ncbi:hypothetical protein M1116_02085 [Patescibacteria group bacterium]|nr:hypothetical protein [Patescibacteria group bacterium]
MEKCLSVVPLTGGALVAGDEEDDPILISMSSFEGKKGTYEVFGVLDRATGAPGPLVETETFRFYVTKMPDDQVGLMKINTPGFQEVIRREVAILEKLQQIAEQTDEDAVADDQIPPHYGAFFPRVVEVVEPNDKQVAMFLGYHPSIRTYKQLVPLPIVTEGKRVDLATVQWILGKLLKVLDFVHAVGYSQGNIEPGNLLLETEVHGVFLLDFSAAMEEPGDEEKREEVKRAAGLAWYAAGGTNVKKPPFDAGVMPRSGYEEYVNFLARIMTGKTTGASDEFEAIYEMANRIWPKESFVFNGKRQTKRPFHVFVSYPFVR